MDLELDTSKFEAHPAFQSQFSPHAAAFRLCPLLSSGSHASWTREGNAFSCATWRAASSLRSSCLIRTDVASSKERGSSIATLYMTYAIYAQLARAFPAGENFAPCGPIQVFARFPVRIEFWRSTSRRCDRSRYLTKFD